MKLKKYFPGFTAKAITFSIDDGSVVYDKIFLDIVNRYYYIALLHMYLLYFLCKPFF